ncbi:MAG: type II secretion system protein GspN [Desulfuromonadaceae bacterium]|nr:type II secretion system protein GspN [Desulfuromonadaceae bacterium]
MASVVALARRLFSPTAGLAALVGISFVVGLWLFFPLTSLQQRLEQEILHQTGIAVQCSSLQHYGLLGLECPSLNVPLPQMRLEITKLAVSPSWQDLVRGRMAIAFKGHCLEGQLNGRLFRTGQIEIDVRNLQLDIAIPQWPQLHLDMRLDAANFNGVLMPRFSLDGLEARFGHVELDGLAELGIPLDSIACRDLDIRLGQENERLEIRCHSNQSAFPLTGEGYLVRLSDRLRSRVKLSLRVGPFSNEASEVEQFLKLFKTADDEGHYRVLVGGTLERLKLL